MKIAQHYEQVKEIGRGGMGVVYQGEDTRTGQPVAIKSLKPDVVEVDPVQIERFMQEGKLLRDLNHPNIVKLLDAVHDGDDYYLVMEYVEGGSLHDVLTETPRLSVEKALYIALDVADALTRAHRLKVLHRDIKPGNVLIAADGTPRLTDFGVARVGESKHTQEGAIVGTLAYIPPEAFQGHELDERSDIWAFGIMLYEMLAGKRPFGNANAGSLINDIMTQPVPPLEEIRPDVPTSLLDLIGRMLTRDRFARIPSVRLVGAELEAIIRGDDSSSLQYLGALDTTGRFESDSGGHPIPTEVLTKELLPANNLPAQPTAFVGREKELDAIHDLMIERNERLLTLLGPGGIGKTRLSLAAAERHLQVFPDGVFFVPLAPVDDSEFLVPTIGEHIGFSFSSADGQKNELLDYLAEKQALLVMDNFEHMIDGADVVGDILQRAPHVKMLVTSRERLRLRGEQIFEVGGMILPAPDDTLENILEHPSVKLFLQSARRARPDFEIDEENAPHVARILALVQGLPLGIELAAAWLEALDITEIGDEIEGSIDFLETDMRDVPERHRSIRAVFEYSWNLMSEEERDVFTRLSIFRGGFEREAAQKVAGAGLRTLTNLVNKSLLQREPTGRYRLHLMLRQFAEEAFADHPEQDAVRDQHAAYYCRLLKKLEPAFNTRKEIAAVEQIETELENARIALRHAIRQGMWEEVDAVIHIILLFYLARSMIKEGIEVFEEIAEGLKAAGKGDSMFYWRARVREVWLATRIADYDRVWEVSQKAYAYFKEHNAPLDEVHALNHMSYVQMMRGDYDESVRFASLGRDITEKINELPDWYHSMGNLGYAEFLRGDVEEARRIYEEIHAKLQEKGYSPSGEAYMSNNLGEILWAQGNLERARDLIQQAYDIFESYKLRRGMSFTLNNLGGLAQVRGDFDEARRMYTEAHRLNREIGDKRGLGHSLSALGQIATYSGSFEEARKHFTESLAFRNEIGDQRGAAESTNDLARVEVLLGKLDDAVNLYNQSVTSAKKIGDRNTLGFALSGRGLAHALGGEFEIAIRDLNEARMIADETGTGFLYAEALFGLAVVALEQADFDSLHEQTRALLQRGIKEQITPMLAAAVALMAHDRANAGDEARALELLALSDRQPSVYVHAIQDRLDRLHDRLANKLDNEIAQAALERGRSLDLNQTAQALLDG